MNAETDFVRVLECALRVAPGSVGRAQPGCTLTLRAPPDP